MTTKSGELLKERFMREKIQRMVDAQLAWNDGFTSTVDELLEEIPDLPKLVKGPDSNTAFAFFAIFNTKDWPIEKIVHVTIMLTKCPWH